MNRGRIVAGVMGTALACAAPAHDAAAVATSTWRVQSPWQFRSGERDGVAIHSDGRVVLGPDARQVLDEGDLYVWSLAADGDVVYAGTGDDGKVYRIGPDGKSEMIWDTIGLEVMALAVDDGTIYAGTAPDATIFARARDGRESTLADTPEQMVWALLPAGNGDLFAATGNRGRIYRITRGGDAAVFFDPSDSHVLALARAEDGRLMAGTGGRGLLYEITGEGNGRVLYDADQEEIRSIVFDEEGRIYFAANAATGRPPQEQQDQKAKPRAGEVSVGEIQMIGEEDSRPPGVKAGGRGTALYVVERDGAVMQVWECPENYIYTLRMEDDGRVLVSTGENGGLYRVSRSGEAEHVIEVDESQVLAVAEAGGRRFIGTGNPGRVQLLSDSRRREGTLISTVQDARSTALWGALSVEARIPDGTRLLVSTRSGNTHEPDETWSRWSEEVPAGRGTSVGSPPARFLQWRLRFVSEEGERTPEATAVQVAYLEQNLAPRVTSVEIGANAGDYFVSGFEGRPQSITQIMPGGVEIQYSISQPQEQKASDEQLSWVRGLRTAKWEAADPNGDNLLYSIYYRGEDESRWKLLAEDLTNKVYTWDTTSFPDGRYEIKIVSTDERSNPKDRALAGERTSRPFEIDNTAPVIERLSARADGPRLRIEGTARDGASRITRLEYAVDGGDWVEFSPSDRIFDAAEETFEAVTDSLGEGEHAVVVKAVDESFNVGSARALVR